MIICPVANTITCCAAGVTGKYRTMRTRCLEIWGETGNVVSRLSPLSRISDTDVPLVDAIHDVPISAQHFIKTCSQTEKWIKYFSDYVPSSSPLSPLSSLTCTQWGGCCLSAS